MRPFTSVPLLLSCLAVAPAAGQTRSESNLVLTILGGVATGHRLWTIEKQPIAVLVGSAEPDTLRLSRGVGSSIVLGAAATYFPSAHVGLHAEISYLGLPVDDGCSVVGSYATDSSHANEQMCHDIQSRAGTGGAVVIFAGVTLRATPRSALSPYVRGSLGLVSQQQSMIEMAGRFVDGGGMVRDRQVIADPSPRTTSVMLGGAAGFTSPLGPGYQFRLEVRDVVTTLDRVTGPVNGLGVGPTASGRYHHIVLTLALDVVLERKRGRRY